MQPPPKNTLKQKGPLPAVVVRPPHVRVGATCLSCGKVSWLTFGIERLMKKPGPRDWRCSCGHVGKVSVGS